MATIKDIADRLGIAISTVSKGLNGANDISDEMRQLVLDTAVEMGYSSKKMRNSNNSKVCIIIEDADYETLIQNCYDIIVGFKLSAARRNWEVTVIPGNIHKNNYEKYDTYMLKNGYRGAFLVGLSYQNDWLSQLGKTSVPTVLLDHYIEDNSHIGFVGTDCTEGIDRAIHHLYELGHRKIAFLNGSKDFMLSNQRQKDFVHSLIRHGLPVSDNLIRYGYFKPECAREFVPNFIQNGATAILCGSDLIASGVIREVHRMGLKVPEHISVIGFDDIPMAAALTPPLTTIRQDRTNLGKSAFILLEGLIHNISAGKLLLRSQFIPRKSTAPCIEQNIALMS